MSPNLSNRWDFRASKEVSPAEAPIVVIPPPPPPPPPTIVSGALNDLGGGSFTGATNFSEFSVAGGLPSGITQFGIGDESPDTLAIVNDATEGNYFSMVGHTNAAWGFGYDAFAGVMEGGEILCRIYCNFGTASRRGVGGAASMSGLVGFPSSDYDCWCAGLFLRSNVATGDIESSGAYINAGGGSVPINGANLQEAFQNPAWCWIRVRKTENLGNSANDDWIVTSWYGSQVDALDASGQPGPDGTSTNTRTISGFDALGWAMIGFGDANEQRISFLSFSNDPLVTPPPLPATVIGGP